MGELNRDTIEKPRTSVYVVELNYGGSGFVHYNPKFHRVICPDGFSKLFSNRLDLDNFLKGKEWRYSRW